MNEQSKDFATMLRKAAQATAEASVVKRPVIRKKQKPVRDAIYGVVEPKKKTNVQNKVLSDQEKQKIWDKNMKRAKKIPMLSKTATALAQMQRSASPQRLPPVPAVPIGRPTMSGILNSAPPAQSNPLWRTK
jgi:hypothetical protein